MKLSSRSFADGQRIPAEFAFGKPGPDSPCILSDNRNPQLAWSGAPDGTRSFVLMCIDTDVPTRGDDVNQAGRTVPHDLPRTDFVHWLMIDIPRECGELAAGSCSDGIVARGKRDPSGPPGSRQGVNDYTGWFAGDAEMAGDYLGYDGPCPPWNDERLHHYRFRLYALDVPSLQLHGRFGLAEAQRAMQGHVLAEAELTGIYSLNPKARG
ncbi:MAG: YbhB/YbcL family Raf kinase inhibitor-like protein [Mizugakiibacter sp.]|uniref:YbhB/YbcL family Raf kinase inhibitor-like protein n=1 Tax=Mizugakiibacter sp. TaxID=1972610 RepID=UPI0031C8456F|nr:YbhB/YbcL family Raf kinase inhibitor-like protein [Xanthomonadaceae bacterium]